MGGCGSKETPSESMRLEQPRVATARAPTSHRPRTSQNRPVSKQHSQRPSSSSTRPSTNSKRPSSSSVRSSSSSVRPSSSSARPSSSTNRLSTSNRLSSSKRTSSGHGGRRPKSSYPPQPTIYEDDIPEENDITEGIIGLCTLIDQHAESFFGVDNTSYARQTIGKALVNHIMASSSNGIAPFLFPNWSHLIARADSGRRDSLNQIGESADRIKRSQRKHPSNWSFGPFERNVWFPSVSQDGVVAKDPNKYSKCTQEASTGM
ncbi:hypothetical protein V2W45_1420371 [Cenococcum geophilum]